MTSVFKLNLPFAGETRSLPTVWALAFHDKITISLSVWHWHVFLSLTLPFVGETRSLPTE